MGFVRSCRGAAFCRGSLSGLGLVVIFGLSLAVVPAGARAQGEGTGAEPRYSESVDIEEFGPAPDRSLTPQVSDTLMVSIAYMIVWLLAVGFMGSIWRRSRALQGELRSAQSRLDALDVRIGEQLDGEPSGG